MAEGRVVDEEVVAAVVPSVHVVVRLPGKITQTLGTSEPPKTFAPVLEGKVCMIEV